MQKMFKGQVRKSYQIYTLASASKLAVSQRFACMADECTDSANKEQFVVCFRWVDEDLNDHEDIIGLYNADKIDSDTLTKTLRHV